MVDKSNDIQIEILPDDYQHYDKLFKVIVIGNSGVGKSCLSFKASKNIFMNNYLATVGFEFFNFNAKIEDKIIKLHIWDTCGQENYRSLVTQFYRDTSLAIIVYAIDDQKSFDSIDSWVLDLKKNSSPDIKIVLIANKADLDELNQRKVLTIDGKTLKNQYKFLLFMETSAKTGLNAQLLFIEVTKILYKEYITEELNKKQQQIKLVEDKYYKHEKHSQCC